MKPSVARISLICALAAGGVLRIMEASRPQALREFWAGEWEYYGSGVELARHGIFRDFPGWFPTAFRLPLYPALIAGIFHACPGRHCVRLVQAALDTAAIGGVYLLGAAIGSAPCGLIAAGIYALEPGHLGHVADISVEPFFGFLMILAALSLIHWVRKKLSLGRAALAGASIGLSLFCRSTLVLLPPMAALWLFRGDRPARWAKPVLVFLAAAYLPMAPWIVRNHWLYGRLVPFENGPPAINAWSGSVGMIRPAHDFSALAEIPGAQREFFIKAHALSESDRSSALWRAAWSNLRRAPASYLLSCLKRLPALWSEKFHWLVLAAGVLLLRPLGPEISALVLFAAYFNIHALMVVLPRYVRPVSGSLYALSALGAMAVCGRMTGLVPSGGDQSENGIRRYLAAVLAPLAGVYVFSVACLAGELRHFPNGVGPVPVEYRAQPGRYAALKHLNDRAVAMALQGDWTGAEQIFDQALNKNPDFGDCLISRGLLRDNMGSVALAEADFERALRVLEAGGDGP